MLQAFQIYGKEPPESFFLNEYIYGFVNASITNLMGFVFGGKDWSHQKKGECMIEALKELDPSYLLFEYHLQQTNNPERFKDLESSKDFKNGMNDATTLVGVSYGFLKPDDPDPVLKKAKKLASKTDDILNMPGSTKNSKLGGAVLALTLHNYIKKTFIK